MLGSNDLIAFVITTDAARAKEFYLRLGLGFVSEDPYAVVLDANGVMVRITPVQGHKPAGHTVLGWRVPDVESKVRELTDAGIVFERYSFLPQDDLGVWTTPDGVAKVAWFKDPDGNVLSVSQH